MHLLHEREEKLAIQKKVGQLEEEKEAAETKRLELEQALEEFVRSTDKKGALAALDKKSSFEQGKQNNYSYCVLKKAVLSKNQKLGTCLSLI